jgi:hypothetical protein
MSDSGGPSKERKDSRGEPELTGTTLRVYRYLYRAGKPCGIHDIQRGLRLSSSSVALYHVRKLLAAGLIKEAGGAVQDAGEEKSREEANSGKASGYVVDKVIFENMIRIRRSLIPVQVAYAIFFATALVILISLLRPAVLSGAYVFALIIIMIACAIFSYQALKAASP